MDGKAETACFKDLGSRFVRVTKGQAELFRGHLIAHPLPPDEIASKHLAERPSPTRPDAGATSSRVPSGRAAES